MGLIGSLKQFIRETLNGRYYSESKIDTGGERNYTCEHYASINDDCYPVEEDDVVVVEIEGTGRHVAVGYIDYINEPKSQKGERRVYGRDEAGVDISHLWLKNNKDIEITNAVGTAQILSTGQIQLSNDAVSATLAPSGQAEVVNGAGYIKLLANGSVDINGAIISTSGKITTPDAFVGPSAIIGGKELNNHTHPAGVPPGNTGVNN